MQEVNRKHYRHIFFDLDNTLWDFEANSKETFHELFDRYQLTHRGIYSFEDFIEVYERHNALLWEFYRQGKIVKEVLNIRRFSMTLDEFGIHDSLLSSNMAGDYVAISPTKTRLFPDAIDLLGYLKERYTLHIITNGFEEVQHRKLLNSGLRGYFESIITSEEAGSKKPELPIFNFALSVTGAQKHESLMIGDDEEVDVLGARNADIDSVLVDYSGERQTTEATYLIFNLKDIYKIL